MRIIFLGKWDVGMHKWEYTPTYRGFDTFYGYYDSYDDYYTHASSQEYTDPITMEKATAYGVDFHYNKDPIINQSGIYTTYLFTEAIQDAIKSHSRVNKPFFIYGAYQTVHIPLEVPDLYLENCLHIPYNNRRIFCGMMQALDEGIMNITETLKSERLINNTVIIFTTDNGGNAIEGSSNWPLRGNKGTLFEGGVRGVAFVWGKMLSKTNYDYTGLMHITDWYRTIVEGIARIELSEDVTEKLDGYNMWQALTQNEPSPRDEILLQLDPPRQADVENNFAYYAGQAALRSGHWKLITGVPTSMPALGYPTGWVHLDGSIDESPNNPSLIWLFNVTADPNERQNVAESYPKVVSILKEKIEVYNLTHILQKSPPFDPRSDPVNFGGVWTPWLD